MIRPEATSHPVRTSDPRDILFNLAANSTLPPKFTALESLYEAWSAEIDADSRELGVEPKRPKFPTPVNAKATTVR